MELTVESAFSAGGLVGHLSYLLLVFSMFMRTMTPLRIAVILSSLAAIAYDAIWLKDPVGLFWETLLIAVYIWQLAVICWFSRRARFSAEERRFIQSRFAGLPGADARMLLNRGLWVDGAPGATLTTEGEPVGHLVYLVSGAAAVSYRGKAFAWCGAGAFIGEMSVLDKGPVSADVALTGPSRFWMISGAAVRRLRRLHPPVAQALEAAFALDWRDKLAAQRETACGAAGPLRTTPAI